jgi:hypothetical protein
MICDMSGAVPIPQFRPWGIVWGIFDFSEITPYIPRIRAMISRQFPRGYQAR